MGAAKHNRQSERSVDNFSTLRAICQAVEIPVVAIGGVTADNLYLLAGSGISGAAVVSGLFKPDNKAEAVRHFLTELQKL